MNKNFSLPKFLENNETAKKIYQFMSKLGPSSAFFSCILFLKNQKMYFLKKDKDFPFVAFDWTMYTFMRTRARTIITSGASLRVQPWVYEESRGTFGKKQLLEIYQTNVHQPYNLFVFTKRMNQQEIRSMICKEWFNYIPMQSLFQKQKQNISFKELAKKVNELKMGPTIFENGTSLQNSTLQIAQDQENFTQLIILSLFEGAMPQKYISNQYSMNNINRDFTKVWESQKISSTAQSAQSKAEITLKFVIYMRRKKNE